MGQQTHRLLQNQQRGHPPIMLGVAGASPVPPPGKFNFHHIPIFLLG